MADRTTPVIVVSIPKAGTYLVSEVLSHLGFDQTWMHLSRSGRHFNRYDPRRLEEGRQHPERFKVEMPLADSLALIGDGAFAVSHLPRTADHERLLDRFRIVFVKRDLRKCLVSRLRVWLGTDRGRAFAETAWYRHPERRQQTALMLRDRGPELLDEMRAIARWRDHAGVTTLSYEQVTAADVPGLLGADAATVAAAVDTALRARTLTRSRGSVTFEDFWGPQAQSVFAGLGGVGLNRALGYELPQERPAATPLTSR
jgi:hypothetical protein